MEIEYEKRYHEVETENWWFVSRRRYLLDILKSKPKDSKILDIGCSSGIFLKDLERIGFKMENLFGIDISEKAIVNCKNSDFHNESKFRFCTPSYFSRFEIIEKWGTQSVKTETNYNPRG